MYELRGHRDRCGGIITPSASVYTNSGVLFIRNEGLEYDVCDYCIIAIIIVGIETVVFEVKGEK